VTPCAALALSGPGMPPIFPYDPLEAAHRAATHPRVLAVAMALSVASEPWALILVALAAYAWLEREVRAVLRAVLPLSIALALGLGIVAAAARIGVAGGWGVRAVPSGHALWGATFAAYTLRYYGRRWGAAAAVLPLAGGAARIWLGSNGVPSVAAGWVIGGLLGALACWAGARLDKPA
jgi:hypothetical protein